MGLSFVIEKSIGFLGIYVLAGESDAGEFAPDITRSIVRSLPIIIILPVRSPTEKIAVFLQHPLGGLYLFQGLKQSLPLNPLVVIFPFFDWTLVDINLLVSMLAVVFFPFFYKSSAETVPT